ncbi:beta-lactamase/transpeptidase-like protein [Phaeosphaeria sp. MPI-PUGE-AT-0046c]|nr:beta-lactamase/transpeptidase-like protein [Phaeosphaeria sp. MPI-PUGE-AT-0046c]
MLSIFNLVLYAVSFLYYGYPTVAASCPPLGPVFPAPKDLASSQSFQAALKNLSSLLDLAVGNANSSSGLPTKGDTYSIQVFSGFSNSNVFETYRQGDNMSELSAPVINGDTVYRIASCSKLFTVFMLLVEVGDKIWTDPLSKYLPELHGEKAWEDVTVGAVAGQLAGIQSDIVDLNAFLIPLLNFRYSNGYPPLEPDDELPCKANITRCSREQFFKSVKSSRFTYKPNTTPLYSNAGYAILGYVLESITGKSFEQVLEHSLVGPLGLSHTSASKPNESHVGAIKYNESFSSWNLDITEVTAEGGIFSSANDMSTFGRAILNSALISPNTTRAWLKPATFTSSFTGAVGRPWEIFRASIGHPSKNRVVDLYTKGGTLPTFQSIFALIPDFNVGFVVLLSTDATSQFPIAELIANTLIPALDEAGREQADVAFSGHYADNGGLNSSVTISSIVNEPGLVLESWISNGTDMLLDLDASHSGFRLFPSNVDEDNATVSAWKAEPNSQADLEIMFGTCVSWLQVGRNSYGKYVLDDFVFQLGDDGRATSLSINALKVVLEKNS